MPITLEAEPSTPVKPKAADLAKTFASLNNQPNSFWSKKTVTPQRTTSAQEQSASWLDTGAAPANVAKSDDAHKARAAVKSDELNHTEEFTNTNELDHAEEFPNTDEPNHAKEFTKADEVKMAEQKDVIATKEAPAEVPSMKPPFIKKREPPKIEDVSW